MAVNHYLYNPNTTYSIELRGAMAGLETGLTKLNSVLATMASMLDGDGSSDAHYTYMTARFGFTDNTVAHNAFSEWSSLAGKLNSDASQTNVNAAMLQAFARFK